MKTIIYTDYDGRNKTIEMTDLEYRSYLIWLEKRDRNEILNLFKDYFRENLRKS